MNAPTTELVAGNVKKVMASHEAGRADIWYAPISAFRIRDGFNSAREADPDYPAHVRMIADSMKANGVYPHKPLTVFVSSDGFLYPSDGHTRLKAALLANEEGAGIEQLPVMTESRATTDEDRIVGLVTNNNGRPLTPYGEGLVCKQLLGRGLDEKQVATRLGFAVPKVRALLDLVGAPQAIRDLVVAGKVSATLAIDVIRTEGADAAKVLSDGAEAAAAAGKAKVTKKRLAEKKPKPQHADTVRLDWLEARRDVAIREWYREGQTRVFCLTDSSDERIAEGPTLREAIDAAMMIEVATARE